MIHKIILLIGIIVAVGGALTDIVETRWGLQKTQKLRYFMPLVETYWLGESGAIVMKSLVIVVVSYIGYADSEYTLAMGVGLTCLGIIWAIAGRHNLEMTRLLLKADEKVHVAYTTNMICSGGTDTGGQDDDSEA